jgi:hypothetical protein
MTFDIEIDRDRDAVFDDTNDLKLVTGTDRAAQSIAISASDEVFDIVGGRVTGKNIGYLEEHIRRGLNEDNDVDEVVEVTIDTFDRNENRVEATAHVVGGDAFNVEVFL